MNPESPTDPRQALEVSLTALVLGELPADQAEFLRRTIAQDAELAKIHERLRQTIDLVHETEKTPVQEPTAMPEPLKLSEERRQELLQAFKTVAPTEFEEAPARQLGWLVPVGVAAVVLVLAGVALLPALSKAKSRGVTTMAARRYVLAPRGSDQEEMNRDANARSLSLMSESVSPAPAIAPPATEVAPLSPKTTIVLPKSAGETKATEPVAAAGYFGGFAIQAAPATPAQPPAAAKEDWMRSYIRFSADGKVGQAISYPAVRVESAPVQSAVTSSDSGLLGGQADTAFKVPQVALSIGGGGGMGGGKPASGPTVAFSNYYTGRELQNAPAPAAEKAAAGELKMRYGLARSAEADDRSKIQELAKTAVGSALGEPIDPTTGLPVSMRKQVLLVDPATGLPAPAQVASLDAASALPPPVQARPLPEGGRQAGDTATHSPATPVLGDMPAIGRLFREEGIEMPARPQAAQGKEKVPQENSSDAGTVARRRVLLQEEQTKASAGDKAGRGNQKGADELAGTAGFANQGLLYKSSKVNGSVQGMRSDSDNDAFLEQYLRPSGSNANRLLAEQTHSGLTYVEEKRKLDELTHFRNTLQAKLEAETTDLKLPKSSLVEIVDRADTNSAAAPSLGTRLQRAITGGVEKKARVKIEKDAMDVATLATVGGRFDPYFAQTEQEVIQSEAVLGKVVEDLKLGDAWARKGGRSESLSKAEAVHRLKTMLDVKNLPNSSVVEIGVKSDQSEDAAKLANAIAEKYRDYRNEERQRLSMGGIEALGERLSETDKRIAIEKEKLALLEQKVEPKQNDEVPRKTVVPPPIPQPEVDTRENAFSTFSLNVSDVSFKMTAASLERGVLPEPGSIRSEEFINAFDYRDPEPAPGMPVGFYWDRARYPFAQNRDVLRFSIKTAAQGRQSGQRLNLVLLLDNSGSMERADRIRIIREALRVLAAQLQPQDLLSVVTFARTAQLRVDGVRGDQASQPLDELSDLTPGGGTNLEEAMNLAYQTALKHYLAGGINRVVLLTDGAANLGDVNPGNLKKKVEHHRKQGIAFDCFGIGWEGYNDDLLEVLSRNGDGRYGFINTPEEAATGFAGQLAGALHVAASDVKVQVEFNPNRVTAWRQIGYARHQLTKQQFRDNTVDAAEIGAAESGNALYVVEVNPRGEGALATVRVRYKVPGTADYHEHEWALPYTGSAAQLEQSSPAMRLATSASALSEWLASNPYAAEVNTDALLRCLSGVPEIYGADPRPKKLEWMIRQAKSLAGK